MCICGPKDAEELLKHHELIRVATKYPHIAKDYFYNKKHQTVEIIKLNGSIELAPIVGLSEVICDIVETGSTLRENGLVVLEEVCPLSARMVVNQVSMKMENERITKLIADLKRDRKEGSGMRILTLTKETQQNILENLLKRSPNSYGGVRGACERHHRGGARQPRRGCFFLHEKFDGADIDAGNILVTEEEIGEAYEKVDPKLLSVIRKALVNIRDYHSRQRQNSWFDSQESGIILGQKVTPLARVGVYVPGGKAVYPSSVLMNVIPAKVAGVEQIIMTTPPGADGKSIRPHSWRQRRRAWTPSIRWAARRRSLRWRSEPRASEGGQDCRPRKYLCGTCKKGCVRLCQHRLHRGAERDPCPCGRDSESALCGGGPAVAGGA